MSLINNRQIILNIGANWLSLLVATSVGFILTPYITSRVGMEAYGLIGLAGSITSYITVLTVALNSMASRFITLEFHKNNFDDANQYFNSVFGANIIFSFIVAVPAIVCILHLNELIEVSPDLISDARWVFILTFISFFISLITNNFGVVYYIINRLELGALRALESNFLRIVLLIIFFSCFGTKVQYCVLSTFCASIYVIIFNIYYTKKFLPEFKIKITCFSFKKVIDLICAGIWNSIGKLSQVLLDGLDILLANLFVGGIMMGYVSVSKTFTSLLITFLAIVSNSFLPSFLKSYIYDRSKSFLTQIIHSIRYLSAIFSVCISCLIIYCESMYQIWLPEQDSLLLRNLTYLGLLPLLFSGSTYCLFDVFTVTNKLKMNSIVFLLSGLLSIGSVFLALKYTEWGIYAIVGMSSFYGIFRSGIYIPTYAAYCLKVSPIIFYKKISFSLLMIIILSVICLIVKYLLPAKSWGTLLLSGFLSFICCVIVSFFIQINKEERGFILGRLKNFIN